MALHDCDGFVTARTSNGIQQFHWLLEQQALQLPTRYCGRNSWVFLWSDIRQLRSNTHRLGSGTGRLHPILTTVVVVERACNRGTSTELHSTKPIVFQIRTLSNEWDRPSECRDG